MGENWALSIVVMQVKELMFCLKVFSLSPQSMKHVFFHQISNNVFVCDTPLESVPLHLLKFAKQLEELKFVSKFSLPVLSP